MISYYNYLIQTNSNDKKFQRCLSVLLYINKAGLIFCHFHITKCHTELIFVVLSVLLTILCPSWSSHLHLTPWIWVACFFSSLLGFSELMSSNSRSQSHPVWIFCSPPLISLTQSCHLLIPLFCMPKSLYSCCPQAIVRPDEQIERQSQRDTFRLFS